MQRYIFPSKLTRSPLLFCIPKCHSGGAFVFVTVSLFSSADTLSSSATKAAYKSILYSAFALARARVISSSLCSSESLFSVHSVSILCSISRREKLFFSITLFKIPYPETSAYLKKIKKSRKKYQKLCVHILDKSF